MTAIRNDLDVKTVWMHCPKLCDIIENMSNQNHILYMCEKRYIISNFNYLRKVKVKNFTVIILTV